MNFFCIRYKAWGGLNAIGIESEKKTLFCRVERWKNWKNWRNPEVGEKFSRFSYSIWRDCCWSLLFAVKGGVVYICYFIEHIINIISIIPWSFLIKIFSVVSFFYFFAFGCCFAVFSLFCFLTWNRTFAAFIYRIHFDKPQFLFPSALRSYTSRKRFTPLHFLIHIHEKKSFQNRLNDSGTTSSDPRFHLHQ